jgi:Nif-specific regulatory protein
VGELPLSAQVKLLRAIQERQFERVGGRRTVTVDVRLVAATNRDLEEAIRAGTFRLDLYHRLQVVEINLPPLRERREDVPLLAARFLDELSEEHGRTLTLTPGALAALSAHDWPGNVRQLRNALERLVVAHADGQVTAADLEWLVGTASPSTPTSTPTATATATATPTSTSTPTPISSPTDEGGEERLRIEDALTRAGHVQARAARLLGMSVRQLRWRIAKYGIAVERF